MVLITPVPGLLQIALKPCALALPKNCHVSQSSETITSGKPKRPINLRTSVTIEPEISAINTAPHNSVASTGHQLAAKPPDCRAIATVPSRITTSSNVVQPTSCTMLSSTGSFAKLEP